jgi:lipid A 4'-phosphatase
VEILAIVLVSGFPLLLLLAVVFQKPILHLNRRHLIYLLLALALGPGLLVNVVLKDHWGRARPDQIERFGGTRRFTPAFVISRECDRNCSFVSGHASVGFSLVSIAFLLRRHRKKSVALAISYGFLIGFIRILQGSHFASDVVFSFFAVYVVAKGLFILMVKKHEVAEGRLAPGDVLKPVTDEKR